MPVDSVTVGTRHIGVGRALTSRVVATLTLVALVATAWLAFAPTAIGGPASYVVTDGVSMLPRFHGDGIVVTQRQAQYHVGEVVAYHNEQLHAVVMHRIVGRDGRRFVFKGDNNDYADQYHPTKAELVGKEWVYWPGAGRYLLMLRNPWTFAVIIGGITMLAFAGSGRSRRRRHHHAR